MVQAEIFVCLKLVPCVVLHRVLTSLTNLGDITFVNNDHTLRDLGCETWGLQCSFKDNLTNQKILYGGTG